MTGYTKLFSSILASTIWEEPKETKILWITMLALSDKNGSVQASIPGLATMSRLTIEETKTALERLGSPDEYSRSKENDGRRISTIEGGWLILNHAKYRDQMCSEERREYLRIKQQECRARKSTNVNSGQLESTESTHTTTAPTPSSAPTPRKRTPSLFVSEEKSSKQKPTAEEIEEFCESIGLPKSDGSAMFLHWEEKAWAKVKDWKLTIRKWKSFGYLPSQKKTSFAARQRDEHRSGETPQKIKVPSFDPMTETFSVL